MAQYEVPILRKETIIEKSGAGTDAMFKPSLWFYDYMAFLIDGELYGRTPLRTNVRESLKSPRTSRHRILV